MPKKGTSYTVRDAMKQGRVPAAPIAKIINRWAAEHWWMDMEASTTSHQDSDGATDRLARFVGVHPDTIGKVRAGRKDWLEFDNADRIVTFIDPLLWHTDPDLAEVYQGFDFSYLDLTRPTCPEADPMPLLDGLSDRHAAAILCVGKTTVNRRRREKALAA